MRVFVYGSLMCEDTLAELGGKRSDRVFLKNYTRAFNKKSTARWGTRVNPGPTLGLKRTLGKGCVGTLFEFSRKDARTARKAIEKREGPSFSLKRRTVVLPDGSVTIAYTAINDIARNTYIGNAPLQQRAQMVLMASGEAGSCYSYVFNIASQLREQGINDREVEAFVRAVELKKQSRQL